MERTVSVQTILDHSSGRVAVVLAQALDLLWMLPDHSVDAIITDPPYSAHVHAKLGKERRNDGVKPREALEFPPIDEAQIAALAVEYVRVCKGWILNFSDFESAYLWGTAIRRAGGLWSRQGAWVKTNPTPQMTGDRPGTGSEQIVICHATRAGLEWNCGGHADIWRGSRDNSVGEAAQHPNQKPAWLVQQLLGAFVPPGGLVLDPFGGSGTTAYAALLSEYAPGQKSLDTACPKCVKLRADEYRAPLPENVRVLIGDGDPKWTAHTIARIQPLLAA